MIHLTKINRVPLVLNSDLIEHIETTPDTVVSLTNGQKLLVLESPETIVERVIQFRRSLLAQAFPVIRRRDENANYPTNEITRTGFRDRTVHHLEKPE